MAQQTGRKRKCQQCREWTPAIRFYCDHCGAILDPEAHDKRLKQVAALKKEKEKQVEEQNKPPAVRAFRSFLRVLETIYLAIVGFIAWCLFWLGG